VPLFKITNNWVYGAVLMCPVIPLGLILLSGMFRAFSRQNNWITCGFAQA